MWRQRTVARKFQTSTANHQQKSQTNYAGSENLTERESQTVRRVAYATFSAPVGKASGPHNNLGTRLSAMPAAPTGIIVIWNDIREDMREQFHQWHSLEHIPERVGIPGFVRGQRWFAESASPQYLTTYTTRDPAVLTSQAYLSRLNQPTPWTLSTVAAFRNTCRAAGTVVWQDGHCAGCGGTMLTARVSAPGIDPAALAASWSHGVLRQMAAADGVAYVRLVASATSASRLPTAERAIRTGDVDEPDLIVLVEGFGVPAQLRVAYEAAAADAPLLNAARVDLYSLQFGRTA